mmetsp:Transcript_102810/g.271682  ORF Transcript_102810/g.271682 Transcript_102810/m.271682 type:complete len:161 (-) Transcript_102810:211-693(-)
MLARALKRSLRPQALPHTRAFAASPLDTTAKLYEDLVSESVKEYQANQSAVNGDLDAELAANKVVLFMEGTPDGPKSEPAMNVMKMLTQAQVAPFLSIDVLTHPAVLGYTVSKSQRNRGPHLYVNGSFYADYDGLMAKHRAGELVKDLGKTVSELPIATY